MFATFTVSIMSDPAPSTTFEHSEKLSDGTGQVTSNKSDWDGKTRIERPRDDVADTPQDEDSSSDDDDDDENENTDKSAVVENQTTVVLGEKLIADEGATN